MKIISFGDVHMATSNLSRMGGALNDCGLIIISGDLTNFGGIKDARRVVEEARQACPNVLAVPGNLDRHEVIDWFEQENIALHGQGRVVEGVGIFGCGGSNITPFNTPLELSEEQIYQTLRRGYGQVEGRRPLLMICHTPPLGTRCDRIVGGKHVGSTAARQFIEEVKPEVCISGHIHESAGIDQIGSTKIFNPGPFKGGGYVVVDVERGNLNAHMEFL